MYNVDYLILVSFLMTSLLGSVHCIGMCGGFATLCAGRDTRSSLVRGACYHAGRLITYLGAGLGASGVSSLLPTYLLGILLIVVGTLLFVRKKIFSYKIAYRLGLLYRKIGGMLPRTSPYFPFLLGLSSTLLPCGWLYVNIGVAAASSNPLLMMILFWMGTLPILTVWCSFSATILNRLGIWLPRLRALLLVVVGCATLFARVSLSSSAPGSASPAHCIHTP